MTTSELLAKTATGSRTTPLRSAMSICWRSALAKPSARAPGSSCARNVGLPPKLKTTSTRGWAARNAADISWKASVSEAAAKTVTRPESSAPGAADSSFPPQETSRAATPASTRNGRNLTSPLPPLLNQRQALLQPLARQTRRRSLGAEGDGVEACRHHLGPLALDLRRVEVARLDLRLEQLAGDRRVILQGKVELDEEVAPHLAHAAEIG